MHIITASLVFYATTTCQRQKENARTTTKHSSINHAHSLQSARARIFLGARKTNCLRLTRGPRSSIRLFGTVVVVVEKKEEEGRKGGGREEGGYFARVLLVVWCASCVSSVVVARLTHAHTHDHRATRRAGTHMCGALIGRSHVKLIYIKQENGFSRQSSQRVEGGRGGGLG